MSSILVFFVGICLALPENPNLRSSSPANNSGQKTPTRSLSLFWTRITLSSPSWSRRLCCCRRQKRLSTSTTSQSLHPEMKLWNAILTQKVSLSNYFPGLKVKVSHRQRFTGFFFYFFFYFISGFVFLDLGLCSYCSCSRHTQISIHMIFSF